MELLIGILIGIGFGVVYVGGNLKRDADKFEFEISRMKSEIVFIHQKLQDMETFPD